MTNEVKMNLFKEMLISECDEYKRDLEDGLFKALQVLGLDSEYIEWSYCKEAVKLPKRHSWDKDEYEIRTYEL